MTRRQAASGTVYVLDVEHSSGNTVKPLNIQNSA